MCYSASCHTTVRRTAWAAGEPNGEQLENCAAVNLLGQLVDISCQTPRGTACLLPKAGVLGFRGGLPTTSTLDTKYVFVANQTNPSQSFFQAQINNIT